MDLLIQRAVGGDQLPFAGDRIVKRFIARESRSEPDRRAPFAPAAPTRLKAVARVRPTPAEVQGNARARSAVMRVAERTEVR
jgi:16S rRNA (cytosine1402-N4)-methyltransferase